MENTLLEQFLLVSHPNKKGYRFSPLMVELLHLVANVPKDILAQTKILPRTLRRYIPFYAAHKGGGAITLGSDSWQSITFTENFFSTDQELFDGRAYANDLNSWLRMAAHEAGHLNHATRYKFLIIYLFVFAYQYLRYGHDTAPLEIEAELGNKKLKQFQVYLHRHQGPQYLHQLILSEAKESKKIERLKANWSDFQSFAKEDHV